MLLNANMDWPAIGALDEANFDFIFKVAREDDLITWTSTGRPGYLLTMKGWERFEELRRGRADSRRAFMAMPFGDGRLDHVFAECYRGAVGAAGFRLARLDEAPKAGSIDDRLRVEIRTSRFLIAEVTGNNEGAYWEAGYAEGLGKPVIFTCERSFLPNVHFDTNHFLHVLWEDGKLEKAAEDLKATIRATLPDEAQMEDEE